METKTYTYGDSSWADLLTQYNGKAITYDGIGNMTSYNGSTYTWMGRELRKITNGSNTYSYKYNADGIRTSKTVNGTTTEFFLNGSQILAQKTGDSVMRFFYDSTGKRVGFANGTMLFYYLYNLQGDVIAIVRAATGQVVAKYSYDAWGNCTVTNAAGYAVGDKNPFRYRGYYYDTETGVYYLNSRYYNPEFGRFISADSVIDNRSATSQNLFAYCENNPINREDSNGNLSGLLVTVGIMAVGGLIGAAISTGFSIASQAITTGTVNWRSVLVSAVTGFVSGAIAASPLGIVGQTIAGGIIGGLSYIADCNVNNVPVKLDTALTSVVSGSMSGYIGGSGVNSKMVLNNTIEGTKKIIGREARRSNQDYAQKRVMSAIQFRNNTLAMAAWSGSAKFSLGLSVSSSVVNIYNSIGLFPNAPTWDMR